MGPWILCKDSRALMKLDRSRRNPFSSHGFKLLGFQGLQAWSLEFGDITGVSHVQSLTSWFCQQIMHRIWG
jgi:hypothetical protein